MVDIPLLWASGARKEAMDLLLTLWTSGVPEVRDQLAEAIIAGPPHDLLAHIEIDEREKSRDRRIFDRLIVLERLGDPPLNVMLMAESARIRGIYPNWRAPDGEQAHFGSWMESRVGPATRYGVDDLHQLSDDDLIGALDGEQELREGLLNAWRQLGDVEPARVISMLERLNDRENPAPADVWNYGLWGVRDSAKQPDLRARLISMLENLSQPLFDRPDVSSAIVDVIEAAAAGQTSPTGDEAFWRLFDRTLHAVALDPSNADVPDQRDWVSLAINRSMGRLATAFFSALFARALKVGSRVPKDLRPRLDKLLAPGAAAHRPARVIAASRLSYLFAVDPDWAQAMLIPSFDWEEDAEEALAAWHGYAWQPRIDEKLWLALKPYFLGVFDHDRLVRLGDMAGNLAQLLMLVGIEFGELPRDAVRNAIRAMPDELRGRAVSWIASFLEQPDEEGDGDRPPEQEAGSPARSADALWSDKVAPWLERVWPPEPALRSATTSEQFALVGIATDDRFPEAVDAVTPYIVPAHASSVLNQLVESSHPDDHPRAVLKLIDALVDPNEARFGDEDLRAIIDRLRAADPQIAKIAAFRAWNDRLRAQQV